MQMAEIKKRYGTEEGNDAVSKILADNKTLFTPDQERVIRFWGQWDGEKVVYSSKKTAMILGITPQTVQNWCKNSGKWADVVEFSEVCGYQIPLALIVDEARIVAQFGKKHNIHDQLFIGYDTLDKMAD